MPPHRRPIRPIANFDRIARLYRWAEYLALGPLLRRTREYFLPQCADAKQALVLGDGDGRFAAALLRAFPALHLHAVDSSRAMLRLLHTRCTRDGNAHRFTFEFGVAPDMSLRAPHKDPYDLIATHFFLDCLSQPEVDALANRLAQQLSPGCRWLLSEFGLPRGRFTRILARIYLRLLYLAFRVLTGLSVQMLPNPQTALAAAGFRRLRHMEWLDGFLYSELWELSARTVLPATLGATSAAAPPSS